MASGGRERCVRCTPVSRGCSCERRCETTYNSQEVDCRVQCPWLCSLCLRKGLETRMKARWFRTCGMLLACASLSVFAACGDDSDSDAGVVGGSGGGSGTSSG